MGGAIRRMPLYGPDDWTKKLAQVYGLNQASETTTGKGHPFLVTSLDTNGRMENDHYVEDQYFFVVGDDLRWNQPEAYSTLGVVEDEKLLVDLHEKAPTTPLVFWTSQDPLPRFDHWGVDVLVLPFYPHEDRMDFNQCHFPQLKRLRQFLDLHPSPVPMWGDLEFWQTVTKELRVEGASSASSCCCVL